MQKRAKSELCKSGGHTYRLSLEKLILRTKMFPISFYSIQLYPAVSVSH